MPSPSDRASAREGTASSVPFPREAGTPSIFLRALIPPHLGVKWFSRHKADLALRRCLHPTYAIRWCSPVIDCSRAALLMLIMDFWTLDLLLANGRFKRLLHRLSWS